jgi:hypothetical protein
MKAGRFGLAFGFALLAVLSLAAVDAARAELLSYWMFDGDATATVGVDGTLVGTAGAPTAATDRNGVAGGALAFDAADQQFVSIPGGGALNGAQAGTISMWVKWTGEQTGTQHGIGTVMARQGVTEAGASVWSESVLRLDAASPGAAKLQWVSALDDYASADSTGPVDEVWRHVAVTFQGDYLGDTTLYIDGVAQGSARLDSLARLPDYAPLTIGGWVEGDSYSTSSIDDVAIFSDMLSPAQIAELAAQTKTPENVGPGGGPARVPIAGVTATASSYFGGTASWGSRHPYFACNGIGRQTTDANGLGAPCPYYDSESTSHRGMWLSNGAGDPEVQNGGTPWIQFDLGEEQMLEELVLWNYNETNLAKRGIQTADIYYSTDGVSWTLFGNESFTQSSGTAGTVVGQSVDLEGITARYIKFENLTNFGDGYYGVNEVDFYAVPEPSALVLLLCAAGFLARRRRSD